MSSADAGGPHQPPGQSVRRLGHHGRRWSLLDHAAGVEHQDVVGDRGDEAEIVADPDQGGQAGARGWSCHCPSVLLRRGSLRAARRDRPPAGSGPGRGFEATRTGSLPEATVRRRRGSRAGPAVRCRRQNLEHRPPRSPGRPPVLRRTGRARAPGRDRDSATRSRGRGQPVIAVRPRPPARPRNPRLFSASDISFPHGAMGSGEVPPPARILPLMKIVVKFSAHLNDTHHSSGTPSRAVPRNGVSPIATSGYWRSRQNSPDLTAARGPPAGGTRAGEGSVRRRGPWPARCSRRRPGRACASTWPSWCSAGVNSREVLEVGHQRERDLVADVGDLQLAHHQAQVLDRAGAADGAVADEAGGLVVPLGEQEVDGVLQRAGGRVVVLRGDEDEAVERADLRRPGLRVRLACTGRATAGAPRRGAGACSRRCRRARTRRRRAAWRCRSTQWATASPLRPGRVLPRMIAILGMSFLQGGGRPRGLGDQDGDVSPKIADQDDTSTKVSGQQPPAGEVGPSRHRSRGGQIGQHPVEQLVRTSCSSRLSWSRK